jgi:hypothetical protein
LLKWSTGHVVPTITASKAFLELDHIQGKRKIWFSSGAYKGKLQLLVITLLNLITNIITTLCHLFLYWTRKEDCVFNIPNGLNSLI